ncbi:insulin-degrading enzyme-like isoform X2 [Paramacrobiotus metropolitanus]|uniref:insulin-degrading enzyme-like isoform X2 n=1 Tax=Paramacrobiotus metropolitanus TaxID=2943436 RepID=UPI00244622EE|nr:insulin-degrading enzyme-like isoform X2 [Paramacrobiotus metropolitanus]
MRIFLRIVRNFVLSASPYIPRRSITMVNTAAPPNPIKRVIENIPKSPQDNRAYRGIILANDLKAIVISDPAAEKAAAALDVNIGCMCDPWKLQGLAHFLEHMLFMGTKKFPEENAFEKYVSEHGGQYNAYTCEEHTNYHFDVAADYLETSLDRFAQFFISPLLTESGTEREVNAVNSEHENNLTSDSRRLDHLSRVTGDPKHDFNKFGTGNKDTLWFNPQKEGVAVREELLKFHQAYYSSNIMSLVVVGKESLDILTDMVVNMFSEVPNKNVTVPHWERPPFAPEQLQTQLKMVPVKDVRSLNIVWPTPDFHPFYKTKPGHYIGGLVGHEGPGSLLSALKLKGWSNTLHAGEDDGANGFQFFMLGVDLTEDGLAHTDEIIKMVYEYLNMLRAAGPQERIWAEEQQIQEIKFRFRDKEKPLGYARALAAGMQKYPIEEVITGPVLVSEYRPEVITDLLKYLVPENMRVAILSQQFKEIAGEKEPIYGIDYCLEKISKEKIETWRNVAVTDEIALPPPNDFIPQHFDILPPPTAIHRLPLLIRKTDMSRLWYLQDIEHKLPKACAFFELCSPAVYKDPLHANLTHVYVELFKDHINEMVYMAELAGMKYTVEQSKYGLTLLVRGYDDKIDVLLNMLVEKLMHFKPDPKRFEVLKEVYGRQLKNFFASEPNRQSMWYFNVLMSELCFTKEELMGAMDALTFDTVVELGPKLFAETYVEGFVYGNVSRKKAELMMDQVETALRSIATKTPDAHNRLRLVQLREGSSLVYHRENDVHKSSCVTNYYQTACEDSRMNMLLELFEQIINEPCFDILRTKEQLGYIVFSSVKNVSGVLGLQILVQSDRNPSHCDQRIESFLQEMEKFLENLTENEFQTHIEALAVKRLEKPKTIMQQASKYWNEIYVRQYNFDRDNLEVAILRTLTKTDLLNFVKDYLLQNGSQRKKLSIHITSTVPAKNARKKRSADGDEVKEDKPTVDPAPVTLTADKVDSPQTLKSKMGLAPLPPKYTDVDTVVTGY